MGALARRARAFGNPGPNAGTIVRSRYVWTICELSQSSAYQAAVLKVRSHSLSFLAHHATIREFSDGVFFGLVTRICFVRCTLFCGNNPFCHYFLSKSITSPIDKIRRFPSCVGLWKVESLFGGCEDGIHSVDDSWRYHIAPLGHHNAVRPEGRFSFENWLDRIRERTLRCFDPRGVGRIRS